MRMVLAIAALVSIAFGLIAVGRAWYEFRPLSPFSSNDPPRRRRSVSQSRWGALPNSENSKANRIETMKGPQGHLADFGTARAFPGFAVT